MKRKTQLASMLLMIAGIISFLSCKENPVDKVKTKTELLTAAPWKRTALISTPAYDWNADGTSSTDVLSIMWPCEKDNLDIYNTNGIIDTDEGPTKCNPSDPQSWTTSWMLVDNESKIRFDNGPESKYNRDVDHCC
jgi:hypothetical protein